MLIQYRLHHLQFLISPLYFVLPCEITLIVVAYIFHHRSLEKHHVLAKSFQVVKLAHETIGKVVLADDLKEGFKTPGVVI